MKGALHPDSNTSTPHGRLAAALDPDSEQLFTTSELKGIKEEPGSDDGDAIPRGELVNAILELIYENVPADWGGDAIVYNRNSKSTIKIFPPLNAEETARNARNKLCPWEPWCSWEQCRNWQEQDVGNQEQVQYQQ